MSHDDVNAKVNGDLISRGHVMFDYLSNLGKRDSYKAKYEALCKAVDDAPAVEAVPVVHARWQYCDGYVIPKCSACDFSIADIGWAFCPHCGARLA